MLSLGKPYVTPRGKATREKAETLSGKPKCEALPSMETGKNRGR